MYHQYVLYTLGNQLQLLATLCSVVWCGVDASDDILHGGDELEAPQTQITWLCKQRLDSNSICVAVITCMFALPQQEGLRDVRCSVHMRPGAQVSLQCIRFLS